MGLEAKLVCTNCDKEVTQETLDSCVSFTYHVDVATLEIDIPCSCGNNFYRVKAEQKAEVLLWPKEGNNFNLGFTKTQT